MAMMIIIAIIEETGVFQWTAFQAYRLSAGRAWLLVLILMGVTAVASALLDNFTTMLLMTPINILIGAHANIGFTDFLVNQTPGVVAALVVMALCVLWHYRAEWR